MVFLKYSVGTANKFGGLLLENDSSEDEAPKSSTILQTTSVSTPATGESVGQSSQPSNSTQTIADKNLQKDTFNQESAQNNNTYNSISNRNKVKGKTGAFFTENSSDTHEKNNADRFVGTSEKSLRNKKPEKWFDKSKAKKESTYKQSPTKWEDNSSSPSFDKKTRKVYTKEQSNDIPNNEENSLDTGNFERERSLDTEETKKPFTETKSNDPVMMDLEQWKSQIAAKRVNLPVPSNKNSTFSNSTENLKIQGSNKDFKSSNSFKNNESQSYEDSHDSNSNKKKSSQTLSYHKLMYKETGQVKLFQGKGRGRKPNPRGNTATETKTMDYKERDAPDFQDSRAFPALGNAKVAS